MLTLIEDLPPDIPGVEATGKGRREDYQKIVIPMAEAMMAPGVWSG
jgi:predicted Zn-dependent protease